MNRLTSTLAASMVSVLLASLVGASPASAAGTCGQPLTDGSRPTIRDCIYIARAALDIVPCTECVCDTNDDGNIRLTDALRCLGAVISPNVGVECPPCESTTTTTAEQCSTCSEVLFGQATVEQLCPSSLEIYNAMTSCPCDNCSEQCPAQCSGSGTQSAKTCFGCLREACSDTLIRCIED